MTEKFQIWIDGQELDELNSIVDAIKKEQPGTEITAERYAENIVRGYLQTRLKNKYITFVQQLPITELQKKLGKASEVKNVQ